MHNEDKLLSRILGPLVDYLFPKFGATVTFIILLVVGFLFYFILFSGQIFYIFKKKNNLLESNIGFWETIKREINSREAIKTTFLLGFGILVLYFFYRAMLSTIYNYPDMDIINYGARWFDKQKDPSLVIVYFTAISFVLLIIFYILELFKRRKSK